jgi:hypothetical protein
VTVDELIRALEKHPGDLRVYVRGYESRIDDVGCLTEVQVHRNVHDEWYYGRHEADPDDPRGRPLEPGLLLRAPDDDA